MKDIPSRRYGIVKSLAFMILLFTKNLIFSQEYYNSIIPTDFGDVNPTSLYQLGNSLLITGIYFNEQDNVASVIISTNKDKVIENHIFSNFAFASKPLAIYDGVINFIAKDRSSALSSFVGYLDLNENESFIDTIKTDGTSNFPNGLANLQNQIFSGLSIDFDGVRKFAINKYLSQGEIIWTKSYEDNIAYSAIWNIVPTMDSNLLVSYTLRYENEFRSNAYLMKIDTDGELIWKTEPMELIDGGATPINITELSNGNIILEYRKNMQDDYEFWCCLVPFTPTFIRLEPNGNIIQEDILRIEKDENVIVQNLMRGRGDYYFSFGERSFVQQNGASERFGNITKYSNNGDTIWTKRYRHPDYNLSDITHSIRDVKEFDNGDIAVLGSIIPAGESPKVWLFKVDENGCFRNNNCEEIQITTSIEEIEQSQNINIYPNPTSQKIQIDGLNLDTVRKIEIFTVGGEKVYYIQNPLINSIDLSPLPTGIYVVRISSNDDKISKKFIKVN